MFIDRAIGPHRPKPQRGDTPLVAQTVSLCRTFCQTNPVPNPLKPLQPEPLSQIKKHTKKGQVPDPPLTTHAHTDLDIADIIRVLHRIERIALRSELMPDIQLISRIHNRTHHRRIVNLLLVI